MPGTMTRSTSMASPADANPKATSAAKATIAQSLLDGLLEQIAGVLGRATDAQYVQKPVGVVHSSIGGHVRHCLDHFDALCRGADSGRLNYDDRRRGTPVETSRTAALSEVERLRSLLGNLDDALLARPIHLRAVVAGDGTTLDMTSSVGRELTFVLSHTVHHAALLAAMCHTLGIPVPERFGYAPATLAHLNGSGCALSPSSR